MQLFIRVPARSVIRHRAARAMALVPAAVIVVMAAAVAAQSGAGAPSVGTSVKVAPGVYEIAVSPSTGTVYVASAGSRAQPFALVQALDGQSLDVKAKIDMGRTQPYGLGINDRTRTLYTSNTAEGSVSAIDLKTGRVVASIKAEADKSAHLREVAVDEASNMVYVSSYSEGAVWAIDGRTNTFSHLIQGIGNGASGLAVDSAARRLYVTNMAAHEIAVVDLATRQVAQRFRAGGERPSNAAFDAKTSRLFVANQGTGDVTVIDTGSGRLLGTVSTGAGALDVEINPAANLGYAANRGAGTVTVFNLTTYAVIAQLPTGSAPNTLAVDAKSGLVYVSNKVMPAPRGGGQGQNAGAAPAAPAPPADDPNGDTVTVITP